MKRIVAIQDIDALRRRAGIDDVELRDAIRALAVGGRVRVTLVTATGTAETVAVRVTSIKGPCFRGKLVRQPGSAGLSTLAAGSAIAFTADHIHSILRKAGDA